MKVILEILRIIIIFGVLGTLGWFILENIYTANEINPSYSWFGSLAILLLLFVLYRNKLQFSGWYQGEGRKKLPKKVSNTLTSISIILMIMPFLFDLLLS